MLNYPINFISITQNNHSSDNAIDLGWSRDNGGPNVSIYAPYYGVVVSTTTNSQGGKRVVTRHDIGDYTYYVLQVHFSQVLVSVNDVVDKNTIVGIMGKTGNATGNHNHIAIFKCPLNTNFAFSTTFYSKYVVDPKEFLYVTSKQIVADKTLNTYGDKIRYMVDENGINYISLVDNLNIRIGPGTNYARIDSKRQLMLNEKVKVYAKSNNWYLISNTNQEWVSSEYLQEEPKESKFEKIMNFIKKIKGYLKKIINVLK